ncbi:MAG: Ldh family oxidoreductase [Propionibacteriales bacterium]|nr:Ldh family oxidoreductase [Propionibacteriales bacterium]
MYSIVSPVRTDVTRLRAFCGAALAAAGASQSDAAVAAGVLVRTDARGVHSHGVRTLPSHVRNLLDGGTTSPVSVEVVRQSAVTAVVDGRNGIGHVVASRAVDLAIDKARTSGVGVALVRNSNHFGAAGHYALTAAEAGFIGLATSNASPIMTAAGSRSKMLSNAPFAYAIPTGDFPMALDISMSATAGMKVRMAAERGEEMPEGLVVDADGRTTTDPREYAAGGALAPLGGHKGYGLALLTETLAGALSGSAMTSAVVPWLVNPGTPSGAGHSFLVMDVESFMERKEFDDRMRELMAEMRSAEPAPGVERVLVPGELEHEHERRALADGLDLDGVTWGHLEQVAQQLDLHEQWDAVPL